MAESGCRPAEAPVKEPLQEEDGCHFPAAHADIEGYDIIDECVVPHGSAIR